MWQSMSRMLTGRAGASVFMSAPRPETQTLWSFQAGKKRLTGSLSWK